MNILSKTIFLLFFVAIVSGCSQNLNQELVVQSPLFEYTIKREDDHCPENQKMSYSFDGGMFVDTGCKVIASDAGNVCKNDNQCVYDCFVTHEYLEQFSCGEENATKTFATEKKCTGIVGRCEAIESESTYTLPKKNIVRTVYLD